MIVLRFKNINPFRIFFLMDEDGDIESNRVVSIEKKETFFYSSRSAGDPIPFSREGESYRMTG